jgi:acetyl-CoA C-acetyltransferase
MQRKMASRLAQSSRVMAAKSSATAPAMRLAQVQRHFSSSSIRPKEIREAYILSAARTPTAKVRRALAKTKFPANFDSLMALFSQYLPRL